MLDETERREWELVYLAEALRRSDGRGRGQGDV